MSITLAYICKNSNFIKFLSQATLDRSKFNQISIMTTHCIVISDA